MFRMPACSLRALSDCRKMTICRRARVPDAFVPIQIFWSDSREASEFQRCGGLMSHLNRTLGGEYSVQVLDLVLQPLFSVSELCDSHDAEQGMCTWWLLDI